MYDLCPVLLCAAPACTAVAMCMQPGTQSIYTLSKPVPAGVFGIHIQQSSFMAASAQIYILLEDAEPGSVCCFADRSALLVYVPLERIYRASPYLMQLG